MIIQITLWNFMKNSLLNQLKLLICWFRNNYGRTSQRCNNSDEDRRVLEDNRSDFTDGIVSYVPSGTAVITFREKLIPKSVKINHVNKEWSTYINSLMRCFNCLRYGRSTKIWRSNPRCAKYTKDHHTEKCNIQNFPCCIHCERKHLATDRKCEEFQTENNVKELMERIILRSL